MVAKSYEYDVFISYARDPDVALALEIERFLEAFHLTPPPSERNEPLTRLRVCLDGSDFRLGASAARQDTSSRSDERMVQGYLARSRKLLVLCSTGARGSRWVGREIDWFLRDHELTDLSVAYTQDPSPWERPREYVPQPLLDAGFDTFGLDLRGYDESRSRRWGQSADFRREMIKLAAMLLDLDAGDLYPNWLEAELSRAREESRNLATTARFESLVGDPARALLKAYSAHEIQPGDETATALRTACTVAAMHHYNRRELNQLTGAGPAYLAGRWKQGDVFVKTSHDGRFRLLVTERGEDGASPPGDVYLVSNASQRVVRLPPPKDAVRRVEDVAFDLDCEHVYVTRQFDLAIYDLDGQIVGEETFSRFTKSPVPVVAGPFGDGGVLGADSKGGLWLVTPGGGRDGCVEIHSEWSKDAVLGIDILAGEPTNDTAAVLFESGRVEVLTIAAPAADAHGKYEHQCYAVCDYGMLFAGWLPGPEPMLATAGEHGMVSVWSFDGRGVTRERVSDPLGSPIDWVTADADTHRLCAVGGDARMHILEMRQLQHLSTLEDAVGTDWGRLRTVRIADPDMPWTPFMPDESTSYTGDPPATSAAFEIAGAHWFVTEQRGEDYAPPDYTVWRVEGEHARCYGRGANRIQHHGNVVLLWSALGSDATALLFRDREVFRLDNEPVRIALVEGDTLWLGTGKGAYRVVGDVGQRIARHDTDVRLIKRLDGRLWLGTRRGAYVVEQGHTVRITEAFAQVRDIKRAAQQTWILTKQDTGGFLDADGPAYLADGHVARRMPGVRAEVSDVLEVGNAAWIVERNRVHRWCNGALKTFHGLTHNVDYLVETGAIAWATTNARSFLEVGGPAYRIDLVAGAVEALDLKSPKLEVDGEGPVMSFFDGRTRRARLSDRGMTEIADP